MFLVMAGIAYAAFWIAGLSGRGDIAAGALVAFFAIAILAAYPWLLGLGAIAVLSYWWDHDH